MALYLAPYSGLRAMTTEWLAVQCLACQGYILTANIQQLPGGQWCARCAMCNVIRMVRPIAATRDLRRMLRRWACLPATAGSYQYRRMGAL